MQGKLVDRRESRTKRLLEKIENEVRSHPIGYGVAAAFMSIGPFSARMIFPDAPLGVVLVGGMALGAWSALCAVPGKFLDDE